MKPYLLSVIIVLSSAIAVGQGSNTKSLEKFTKLKVYDRIVVSLVKSNENKLVITGDDKDEVSVSQKDGLLKIKMKFDNFIAGNEAKATLYFTEDLTLLDANENGKIISDETFKGDKVEIKAQEGGVIDLKVTLKEAHVRAVSGSEITLRGTCETQEVSLNTGGKAYNKDLNTTTTNLTVLAGGRADIKASDLVKAKVKAGGSIYIYGKPKSIEKDKIFGGKIKEMD
ncbi:head GIN domain-containing protein [Maribacter aestuarii]|uniref:head GIN domain-containing protein n=1 Tax=Maribacter aestuarii TaxID=1130723 RepID=UPI00248C5182|nr:head GIN domain-containing protein [Maribacter aestuarii]